MLSFYRKIFLLLTLSAFIAGNYGFGYGSCPADNAALMPSPLEEEWAVDWWMPRHKEKLTKEGRENTKLLFLGDSITHGWESEGNEVWEHYYSEYDAYNLGFSGDRTENVLWRLQNGEVDGINPDVAILLIGTNNTGHRQDSADCTARGIEMILDELHERLPETHVLLLGIFPRSFEPGDKLRQLNNKINSRIEKFDVREKVTFLNINDVFLDDEKFLQEKIMPDFLHPNKDGYKLWAEAMDPALKELFNK